jgi:uncharacterized HAD superfamily protein
VRVAIDIDSTLHHYWDGFAAAARRRFGVHLPYRQQSLWEITELRPDQVRVVVEETHSDRNILAAEPYPGAVETVRAWRDAGHFIHITSHRADTCHAATKQWLERIGLPYDELYCSWDKVSRCLEIGIDVLIDDSPVNLQRALDAGLTVASIVHPWNRDLCEDEEIVCAGDWAGLRAALAPLLEANAARAGR